MSRPNLRSHSFHSFNETSVKTYEKQLFDETDGSFISLRQLSSITSTERVVNIYGVIDCVNRFTHKSRKISVIDPTISSAIHFIVSDIETDIVIKNIIRLTNISIEKTSEGKVFKVKESKNLVQISTFCFDYESNEDNNPFQPLINPPLNCDKPVAKLLEEWFANNFLHFNSFDKLSDRCVSTTGANQLSDTYIDFACLIIGTQLMKQSLQLTVFDGTKPSVNVFNQYLQYSEGLPNQYHRINTEAIASNSLDNKYLVFLNVWRNKMNENNDHFNTSKAMTLLSGDDMIIAFNIQICKPNEQSFALHLRTGRHYGKGIRKVNRLSVLGRLLMNRINECQQTIDVNNALPTDYLISLGIRKLEALYRQQAFEKDFPLCYRSNEFVFDLKTIENVLNELRKWFRFPNKPFVGSVPQMQTIRSIGSFVGQLVVIRAKVIDYYPKCVLPVNQFIYLKCSSCRLIQTYKTHENSVCVNLSSNSSHSDKCHECLKSGKTSKLYYFYSFLFTIQDSNCNQLRVCLQKQNANNVFGFDAQQVLNDTGLAIRLDNTLMQILRTSNLQKSIDWIIKVRNTCALDIQNTVHEVISLLAPKSH